MALNRKERRRLEGPQKIGLSFEALNYAYGHFPLLTHAWYVYGPQAIPSPAKWPELAEFFPWFPLHVYRDLTCNDFPA